MISQNCDGAVKMKMPGVYENSNLFHSKGNSDFFSDCLPWAICLQSEQGCFPSNVRSTAFGSELVRRFSASIVVHATDWRICQCAPIALNNAKTVST